MRLDKYVSHASDLSRKEVKRLMWAGHVTVDGEAVTDPGMHIDETMKVCVDCTPLEQPRSRYYMLHKPLGYVCVTKDGKHQTVLELLDEHNKDKLQIAGRLDIDATGLVLITDDGKWNHAVTSPKRGCKKTYYVALAKDIDAATSERLQKGVMLEGETKLTLPANLELLSSNEARLTISEGRYHQVKRMFAAVGNRVEQLHREQVGYISLDAVLEPGEYRKLSEDEIASVRV